MSQPPDQPHDPYAPPTGYGPQPGAGAPQPYAPPPGYAQQPGYGYGAPQQERPLDGVSVAGLVAAVLVAPIGTVLSIIGLVRTSGGKRRGRGLAIAGLIVSVVLSLLWVLLFVAVFALGRFVEESVPGGLEGLEDLAPLTEVDPAEAVDVGTPVDLDGYEVTVTAVDLVEPPAGGDPVVTASVEATRTGGGTGEPWFELLGTWFEADGTTSYDEGTCPPDVTDPVEQAGSLEEGETTTFTWCFPVDPGAGSAGYVALGGTFGLGATGVWSVG